MEDVWQYPRPPRLERCTRRVRVVFAGVTIVDTDAGAAWRVLETSHPPGYYIPREAFVDCVLEQAPGHSFCEWKGAAEYWTVRVGARVARRCGWSYPEPSGAFEAIRDHVALYAGAMDRCLVGDDVVMPQPGGFYGGWITPELRGPFKGGPGSMGW